MAKLLLLAALSATAVAVISDEEISRALRLVRDEISELKTNYKQLKAENRALRFEVDELKSVSTYPAGTNATSAGTPRNDSTTGTNATQLRVAPHTHKTTVTDPGHR
jgi:regulator of replication initiation timing